MIDSKTNELDYDYVVIGSGFGGAVSALRLAEKGYSVLVLEKGMWFSADRYPKTIWNIKRWLWIPTMRFFGLFKLTYFRHVAILSGVGVGGGSLVYANTLPIPKKEFYTNPSWSHLANWEQELAPFYITAKKMLGATTNPSLEAGDLALKKLAKNIGKESLFEATEVAVFFGEPETKVADPFFDGKGPERSGCTFCGGCMVGCRFNAKNTLDKNYLHLAAQLGVEIKSESEVYDVHPLGKEDGSEGYRIKWKSTRGLIKRREDIKCKGVVFSGGVLGSVKLLLNLKRKSLPLISEKIGTKIRTNSEALIPVTSFKRDTEYSKGVAIGSILHTDENSHLEPVRYSNGSGAWRLIMGPMVSGSNVLIRILRIAYDLFRHPLSNLKLLSTDDWAKRTSIMLFMQTIESTLRFSRGWFRMKSSMEEGPSPTAFIPEANDLAKKYAKIINGKPTAALHETLFGIPSTAHILGGVPMGKNIEEGVIDRENRVFAYKNMLVCDGSMISANPGVNPALTITALSERAMSKIPAKDSKEKRVGN